MYTYFRQRTFIKAYTVSFIHYSDLDYCGHYIFQISLKFIFLHHEFQEMFDRIEFPKQNCTGKATKAQS